jgi:predicted nuclease of predicted toxin-antitoxin system
LRWSLSKLLADENISWPLIKLLRGIHLNIEWILETDYRGISGKEAACIVNDNERIVLTRDNDLLEVTLRKDARYGIIYIAEAVRKDNVDKLTRNMVRALEMLREEPSLIVITINTIGSYPLIL